MEMREEKIVQNYSAILKDSNLQIQAQDILDSLFGERCVAIRNCLRKKGYIGNNDLTVDNSYSFIKPSTSFSMNDGNMEYQIKPDYLQVGAGKNVVGVKWTIISMSLKGNAPTSKVVLQDDLTKTPTEFVEVMLEKPEKINQEQTARSWKSKTVTDPETNITRVMVYEDKTPICEVGLYHLSQAKTEANARLIAAAPDLETHLQEIVSVTNQFLDGILVSYPSQTLKAAEFLLQALNANNSAKSDFMAQNAAPHDKKKTFNPTR